MFQFVEDAVYMSDLIQRNILTIPNCPEYVCLTACLGLPDLRQELINLISYVKKGEYRAMSECSNYQLLLQTDYVRLREKYDHLYIYSHYTIMHCPQGIISAIFEAKDYCSVEWSDAIVRQLLSAKQWLTETRRITTAKCENYCPVEWSDYCCKTITACETVVDRNSTVLYYQFVM